MLACILSSEFNKVSAQELFLMWCIYNQKQVCWTYWIFNQLFTCTTHKDAPLIHGHVVTIIAKTLNVNFYDFPRVVECSYFTKKTFMRGDCGCFFLLDPGAY